MEAVGRATQGAKAEVTEVTENTESKKLVQ